MHKSGLYIVLISVLSSLNMSTSGGHTQNNQSYTGDTTKSVFNGLSVVMNSGRAEISWTCTDEKNMVEKYVIEKSYNGKTFYAFSESYSTGQTKSYKEYYETDFKPGICYRVKCKTTTEKTFYSEIKFLKKPEVKIAELKDQILVLLRDKSGNEFTSKLNFSNKNGTLNGDDPEKKIVPGDYLIVASANESLKFSRVLVVK